MSASGALRFVLSAGLLPTAAVSAALGVCFHRSIRTIEIDYRLWRLIGIYAVFLASLMALYVNVCSFTFFCAVERTVVVSTSFNTGLASSILIYRAFFHRLKDFPGPFGARVSRLYASAVSSKSLQYYLELQKMHDKYGDVVRTGKNTSIVTSDLDHCETNVLKDRAKYQSIARLLYQPSMVVRAPVEDRLGIVRFRTM